MPVAGEQRVADPQQVAAAELKWYRENPQPKWIEDRGELTLYNFPVAKADLAPAHVKAIEDFGAPALLAASPNIHGQTSRYAATRARQGQSSRTRPWRCNGQKTWAPC